MPKILTQLWHCDICSKNGSVEYFRGDAWFRVSSAIGKNHKSVSPECAGDANKVRNLGNGKFSLVDKNGITVIVKAAR